MNSIQIIAQFKTIIIIIIIINNRLMDDIYGSQWFPNSSLNN